MVTPDPPAARPTVVLEELDDTEAATVVALVGLATRADGASALNEHALLHLGAGSGAVRHVLARDGAQAGTGGTGALVAYAQLDESGLSSTAGTGTAVTAECVVHPGHRRSGWGSAVVARALREVAGAPLLLWSHGDHPGAAAMSERLGFARVRDLWQLRRPLGVGVPAPPAVAMPDGVRVRTFRVGVDEPAWLELNARAFAGHPEQGAMDAEDLAARTGSEWFDPDGFFLAERDVPGGVDLVGFHWTKEHRGDAPGRPALGEVYVLGVDPHEQGSGLGSALTAVGVRHLASRGMGAVLLYVEADNAPALRVYQRLGFQHVATDTQYRHPGAAPV